MHCPGQRKLMARGRAAWAVWRRAAPFKAGARGGRQWGRGAALPLQWLILRRRGRLFRVVVTRAAGAVARRPAARGATEKRLRAALVGPAPHAVLRAAWERAALNSRAAPSCDNTGP